MGRHSGTGGDTDTFGDGSRSGGSSTGRRDTGGTDDNSSGGVRR